MTPRRACRVLRAAAIPILPVLAAAALSITAAHATDYRYQWGHPSPQGNTVFGMAFASATEGWAVCGGGSVLHTTDAGVSWSLQQGLLAVAPDLYDIVVTPSGTLIACGAGDALFRSVDGGAHWSKPAHPPATDLRDLCLVPGGAVSAAGTSGTVLRSTDDGLTWTSVGPGVGTIRHHAWRTATEAYAVGQEVSHRTTNGGATWTQFIPGEAFGYNDVSFVSPTEGYVQEDFGYWKTANAGASWTEHFVPVNPLYRYRLLPLSAQHWLIICNGEGGELWETVDAGDNWELRQLGGSVGLTCIVQAPGGRVFYGSDTGDLIRTDDLGQTIANATTNFGQEAPGVPIEAFHKRPDGVLFAANQPNGGETTMWIRSDDGGLTWSVPAQTPGIAWPLFGGFFDNQRGFVGSYGDIRATFDGGDTWQNATLPSGYSIVDAALPAANRYFAACYRNSGGGGVFRSTDGGLTWAAVGGGLPQGSLSFWAISFPTPSVGYASGSPDGTQLRLYKTTDGGVNWQLLSPTGLGSYIRDMVWFDANVGVASPGWQDPDLHRTTDGGLHWEPIGSHPSMEFARKDGNEALALPVFPGDFLRTTDAGATWEPWSPPFSGPFPGMHEGISAAAPLADGWALGSNRSRIIVAREFSPAGVHDGPATAGMAALRMTAEPNPLAHGTKLQFSSSVAGRVLLEIVDTRGARVATLIDEEAPAGSHSVAWDGTDGNGRALPAGSYFARVRTAHGTGAVKLTVIR